MRAVRSVDDLTGRGPGALKGHEWGNEMEGKGRGPEARGRHGTCRQAAPWPIRPRPLWLPGLRADPQRAYTRWEVIS